MVHNHHSSFVHILQVLLMVGHLEVNDQLSTNYGWWSIRDFAIIHRCWKENEINPRMELPLTTTKDELKTISIQFIIQQFQRLFLTIHNKCLLPNNKCLSSKLKSLNV
jgi:hypothetical protein